MEIVKCFFTPAPAGETAQSNFHIQRIQHRIYSNRGFLQEKNRKKRSREEESVQNFFHKQYNIQYDRSLLIIHR